MRDFIYDRVLLMDLCVYNIDKVVVDRTKEASVAHPPVMFMAVILTASSS